MVDQKNKSTDEEYQFPQGEYVTSDDHSTQQSSQTEATEEGHDNAPSSRRFHFPEIRNKRVVLTLAIIVIAIIAVRFFNSEHAAQQTAKPSVLIPAEPTITVPQPSHELSDSLNALQDRVSRTDHQMQALQSQVVDMQNRLDQARADNRQLKQTVVDLSTQFEALTEQVNQLLGAHHIPVKKATPQIIFHLRAIVPDRAWITSDTGEALTVTIGDHVPSYGTIRTIDSKNGVIETSGGRRIVYGQNDF